MHTSVNHNILGIIFNQFDEQDYWYNEFTSSQEETKVSEMKEELSELGNMTDEQACKYYNVDSKQEAELLIKEHYAQ